MVNKNIKQGVHIKAAGENGTVILKARIIILALIIIISIVLIACNALPGTRQKAATRTDTGRISYISVLVIPDDTLWDIAGRYYSAGFGTLKDYVKEIKRCNSLESDNIYAGRHIIVPVIYPAEGGR
ncbi:MAG: LysM peptidoglycan-binding domain-containing protein [Lachnospiraceae bacterium]